MLTVSSMEAQNRFWQLLHTVQREPVTITRHGRTAAFIVSPQDMADLQDVKKSERWRCDGLRTFSVKLMQPKAVT